MDEQHPLLGVLHAAAAGRFPPVDGNVTVLPGLRGGQRAVVALTGHAFVMTDQAPDEVLLHRPDGFGGALSPSFLIALAGAGSIGVNDCTLVSRGLGGGNLPERTDLDDHYRVRHARALRSEVAVHGDERGFVTLADGLAGRREMSIELVDHPYSAGAGRALVTEARRLTDADEWLFAAVSPGNARSLRSFLAAGFVPLGSEVIIAPPP